MSTNLSKKEATVSSGAITSNNFNSAAMASSICLSKSEKRKTTETTSAHRGPKLAKRQRAQAFCALSSKCSTSTGIVFFLLISACLVASSLVRSGSELHRAKRALYELPDGSEYIVGPNIRTSFSCDGLGYGYYADQENDCKIFHICQSFKMSDGSIYNNHWSFMCGNQTIFNQVSLSCSHPEDSVPCESARDFYYINDYFGDLRAPSVKDSDLSTAHDLVSRSYGARLPTNIGGGNSYMA